MQRHNCPKTQLWMILSGEWTETQGTESKKVRATNQLCYLPKQPCRRIAETPIRALSITTSKNIKIDSFQEHLYLPLFLNLANLLSKTHPDPFQIEEILSALPHPPKTTPTQPLEYLNQTLELLHDYPEKLTLRELALHVGISPNHLSTAFHRHFKISISRYRRLIQLQKSLQNHWTDGGFYDQSHFYKACKSELNLTSAQVNELLKTS